MYGFLGSVTSFIFPKKSIRRIAGVKGVTGRRRTTARAANPRRNVIVDKRYLGARVCRNGTARVVIWIHGFPVTDNLPRPFCVVRTNFNKTRLRIIIISRSPVFFLLFSVYLSDAAAAADIL